MKSRFLTVIVLAIQITIASQVWAQLNPNVNPAVNSVKAAFDNDELAAAQTLVESILRDGSAEARYQLGRLLETGVPVKVGNPLRLPDLATAQRLYELTVSDPQVFADQASAKVALAKLLLQDSVDERDIVRSQTLLQAAMAQKSSEAARILGQLQQQGLRGEPNQRKAESSYRFALQQGNANAALALADLVRERNPQQAATFIKLALKLLLQKAQEGDVSAMFKLGKLYREGMFVNVNADTHFNSKQAKKWLERTLNADDRDVQALIALAEAHAQDGWLTYQPQQALAFYRRAADAGSIKAALAIGSHFTESKPLAVSAEEAVLWLERAAELDSADALLALATLYRDGKGVAADAKRAADLLKRAADLSSTNSSALIAVGRAYQDGLYGDNKLNEAVSYFARAAKLGSANAMYEMGRAYADGAGITADPAEAVRWFKQASEQGNARSMIALAQAYQDGRGVAIDREAALNMYQRAAREGGSVTAMRALAEFYRATDNPDIDFPLALDWLERAAEGGSTTAMLDLGRIYARGVQVEHNLKTAARWFELAAERGNTTAMQALGDLHRGDFGPPVDYQQAILHYRRAWQAGLVKGGLALAELLLKESQPEQAIAVYEQLAASGSVSAAIQLSILYASGEWVTRDFEVAEKWLARAEQSGTRSTSALVELGSALLTATGPGFEPQRGIELLETAATRGDTTALRTLARTYREGRGVSINLKQAIRWSERAVAAGVSSEVVWLARAYARGTFGAKQPDRAFKLLREAAQRDPQNRSIARELANAYKLGIGTEPDPQQSTRWLRRAARAGSTTAQLELAKNYITGIGVEADPNAAIYWLNRASRAGSTSALITLGRAYASGFGVEFDHERAYGYFKQAADRGSVAGLREVARGYATGFGVAENIDKAIAAYQSAAKQGDITSMIELHNLFSAEFGPRPDSQQAMQWLNRAANNGSKDAMFELGINYLNGNGVKRNQAQAIKWLRQAEAAGHWLATEQLARIDGVIKD